MHGAAWAFAYFLYLPYTVTFVVYDLLPVAFPGIVPYRAEAQLALAGAIVCCVLAPERAALWLILACGVAQIALLPAFAGVVLAHAGAPSGSFAPDAPGLPRGAGNSALLYICASLPLYLGGEVAVDPEAFYERLLGPSLLGLYASHVLVYATYPRFAARLRGVRLEDVLAPAVATALMVFGLYVVLT